VYWLPTGIGTVVGGFAAARPLSRRLPVPALTAGCALVLAAASVWLARLTSASGYAAGMLPAFAAAGVALGIVLAVNMPRASAGAGAQSGVAAGLLGTCQQVGAAVGLAVAAAAGNASTRQALAAWAAAHRAVPPPSVQAAVAMRGFNVALAVTAGIAAAAAAAQVVLSGGEETASWLPWAFSRARQALPGSRAQRRTAAGRDRRLRPASAATSRDRPGLW
jgi:hypothetical protein